MAGISITKRCIGCEEIKKGDSLTEYIKQLRAKGKLDYTDLNGAEMAEFNRRIKILQDI